jgi:hypothetical protein
MGAPRECWGDRACQDVHDRPNDIGHVHLGSASRTAVKSVNDLTARQLGLITRAQALAAGLSRAAISHRLRRGIWIQLRPGLYVVAGTPRSWEQDVLGAVLLAGAAWASHATSARFWRYPDFGSEERIEVTVLLPKRVRQDGVVVHRSGLIEERDLRVIRGVPCMSAARTIVDLSSRLSVDRLGRLVDDGLRRGILTIGGLDHEVRRFWMFAPGRSPKALESVMLDRVPGYHGTKSHLERDVLDAIVKGGLPAPVQQYKVVVRGEPYYLDMAYPEQLLAIEVDGFDFHRGRDVFDSDRARQNDIVNLGWRVLRFTSAFSDERIVADVRRALFGRSITSERARSPKQS